MRALGFDVKKAEVQAILREYDHNGDGLIAERDFVEVGMFAIYLAGRRFSVFLFHFFCLSLLL